MKLYDISCPVCGTLNRRLDLEETGGCMECEHCGQITEGLGLSGLYSTAQPSGNIPPICRPSVQGTATHIHAGCSPSIHSLAGHGPALCTVSGRSHAAKAPDMLSTASSPRHDPAPASPHSRVPASARGSDTSICILYPPSRPVSISRCRHD